MRRSWPPESVSVTQHSPILRFSVRFYFIVSYKLSLIGIYFQDNLTSKNGNFSDQTLTIIHISFKVSFHLRGCQTRQRMNGLVPSVKIQKTPPSHAQQITSKSRTPTHRQVKETGSFQKAEFSSTIIYGKITRQHHWQQDNTTLKTLVSNPLSSTNIST